MVFVIQIVVVFRFILSICIAAFRWQPLCYKPSPGFAQNFRKKPLHFCKYIWKIYCLYRLLHPYHDDKTCFLPACKYHVILLGNAEDLLKKLDTFYFTYQHVDCLYTLFKYRFSEKVIAKSGQVFDNVQGAVDFNHRNKGIDRMPSIEKKENLKEKIPKSTYSAPFKRQKQRRPVTKCLQKG